MRSKITMCQYIKYILEFLGEGQYRAVSVILSLLGTILNVIRTIVICWLVYEKFKTDDRKDEDLRGKEKVLGIASAVLGAISVIQGIYIWRSLINNNNKSALKGVGLGICILLCAAGFTLAASFTIKSLTIIFSFIFDDIRVFIEIFTVLLTTKQKPYEGRNPSNRRRGYF